MDHCHSPSMPPLSLHLQTLLTFSIDSCLIPPSVDCSPPDLASRPRVSGSLAQSVEQRTFNPLVVSSNLARPTNGSANIEKGSVAQLVEQRTLNPSVQSSSLCAPTKHPKHRRLCAAVFFLIDSRIFPRISSPNRLRLAILRCRSYKTFTVETVFFCLVVRLTQLISGHHHDNFPSPSCEKRSRYISGA